MGVDHKKRGIGGWLAIALLLGMLIWVRLRLVTEIPRAAYAEPVVDQSQQVQPEPAGHVDAREPSVASAEAERAE